MESAFKPIGQPAAAGGWIKEVTAQTFMQDVVQASLQTPVLVYFTAPWCGPCKQLGPLIEKQVNQANGALRLAKVNIDNSPEIAQQFRVQSVPAVYAFVQGQPVDAFMGAVPESELKQFIARLGVQAGDNGLEELLQQAEAMLQAGDFVSAEQLFKMANEKEPQNMQAIAGAIKCHTAAERFDQADVIVKSLPDTMLSNEHISAAKAALDLARIAVNAAGQAEELKQKLQKNPDDHESRLAFAIQMFALGQQEEAIDSLLMMIEKDRAWNEEAARKQLVNFFEVLGHTHPHTLRGRRKLSSILFS